MEWCFTRTDGFFIDNGNPQDLIAPSPVQQEKARCFMLLSIGDCILPGFYSLHSRFRRAANFLCGENLISLVDTSIGAGPFNIVVEEPDSFPGSLHVMEDSLCINGDYFNFDTITRYNSTIEIPLRADLRIFQSNLILWKNILRELAPSKSIAFLLDKLHNPISGNSFEQKIRERFLEGSALIAENKFAACARHIKGIGFGLTPSGDDFISGLLIALNICEQLGHKNSRDLIGNICAAAASRNPLSAAFMRSAKDGRLFEKMKQMISSLFKSDTNQIIQRTMELLTVGATSGADTAVGIIHGIEGENILYGH